MKSEIEQRASFDFVRYAMCWEDADVLLEALAPNENDTVMSIASAGDNSFSFLAENVKKVYAIDLNETQIFQGLLRKACYTHLNYDEFIAFSGVLEESSTRIDTYKKLREFLSDEEISYWDERLEVIEKGFMNCGKFENYFKIFREKVLPLVHSKKTIDEMVLKKTTNDRINFYNKKWNNLRFKMLFSVFFSRYTMGKLGRDKEFFKHVYGSVSKRILKRVKHALTELDTSKNPYLHYILFGKFISENALPHALRRENFDKIAKNIDRIEFFKMSIEQFIKEHNGEVSLFNLSDIFEYMTEENMDILYEDMLKNSNDNAKIAYWNMLAPRKCSDKLKEKYNVSTDDAKNKEFLENDKAFFYSAFYLDTICRGDAL